MTHNSVEKHMNATFDSIHIKLKLKPKSNSKNKGTNSNYDQSLCSFKEVKSIIQKRCKLHILTLSVSLKSKANLDLDHFLPKTKQKVYDYKTVREYFHWGPQRPVLGYYTSIAIMLYFVCRLSKLSIQPLKLR